MTDLLPLISRVRGLSSADRETDALVEEWIASLPDEVRYNVPRGVSWTGSVDAVLALAEKVLPGWGWNVWAHRPDAVEAQFARTVELGVVEQHRGHAPTPALALLLALLLALGGEA